MLTTYVNPVETRGQNQFFRRLAASFGLFAAAAGVALVAAPASQAAEADYIVLYKAGTNVSAEVRSEEARGNDVQDVFRSAVKGIVAPLDSADVARLRNDSDVLLVERDGPVRAFSAGPRDQSPATWPSVPSVEWRRACGPPAADVVSTRVWSAPTVAATMRAKSA